MPKFYVTTETRYLVEADNEDDARRDILMHVGGIEMESVEIQGSDFVAVTEEE